MRADRVLTASWKLTAGRWITSLICAALLLASLCRTACAAENLLDTSHAEEGYITVLGSLSPLARAEVTSPDGQVTPYPLPLGRDAVLPLCGGQGAYRVTVFEETPILQFAAVASRTFSRVSADELAPFLIPSLYVNYSKDSECAKKAQELFISAGEDRASFIDAVYDYIISNITYDEDFASEVPSDYLPDPDKTLLSGRGICLDYASLMAAMLRSCGVPARLITGNFGAYYHAWVSATEDIPADRTVRSAVWKVFDPTLGASNSTDEVMRRIKRGTDYIAKHVM